MSDLHRTTVYLDREDFARLKTIAQREGRRPATLIREAVAEYTARRQPMSLPRSLGAGRSGRGDLSERAEELLAGLGDER